MRTLNASWRLPSALILIGATLLLFIGMPVALHAQDAQSKDPQAPSNGRLESNPPAAQASKIPEEVGSVTGHAYTSDFFGFAFDFPKGWSVQSDATLHYLTEGAIAMSSAGDPSKKAVLDFANTKSFQLLMVSVHPFGTPVPFNPSILVTAKDVSFAPGIKNGSDYLQLMKMSLKQKPNMMVLREPTDLSFGGLPFSRMDLSWETVSGTTVYESCVATMRNRYVVSFLFFENNRKRLDELVETMNTIQFKPETNHKEVGIGTSASSTGQSSPDPNSGVQLLTSTGGVDFSSYLADLSARVRHAWYSAMPASALKGEKGKVAVVFRIARDGFVPGSSINVEESTGSDALREVAINAISETSPFGRLPLNFRGPYIELRFVFLYNIRQPSVSPPD